MLKMLAAFAILGASLAPHSVWAQTLPSIVVVVPDGPQRPLAEHALDVFTRDPSIAMIQVALVAAGQPCPDIARLIIAVVPDKTCRHSAITQMVPQIVPFADITRGVKDTTRQNGAPTAATFSLSVTRLSPGQAFGQSLVALMPRDGRLALAGDRTMLARLLRLDASNVAMQYGRKIVFNADFQAGARDYRKLASSIVAGAPTDVAVAAFPAEAAILIRELKSLNPALRIHGSYLLANPSFAAQARESADGVTVALGGEQVAQEIAPHIRARLQPLLMPVAGQTEARKAETRATLLFVFAALDIADQLFKSATAVEPSALAVQLRLMTFTTPFDIVRFDQEGRSRSTHLGHARWRGGVLVREDRLDRE